MSLGVKFSSLFVVVGVLEKLFLNRATLGLCLLATELELADVASVWTETRSLARSATSPLPSWGLKTGVQAVKFESGRRIGSSALSLAAVGLK